MSSYLPLKFHDHQPPQVSKTSRTFQTARTLQTTIATPHLTNRHYPPVPAWDSGSSNVDKLKQLYFQNYLYQRDLQTRKLTRHKDWSWIKTPILLICLVNLGTSLFLNTHTTLKKQNGNPFPLKGAFQQTDTPAPASIQPASSAIHVSDLTAANPHPTEGEQASKLSATHVLDPAAAKPDPVSLSLSEAKPLSVAKTLSIAKDMSKHPKAAILDTPKTDTPKTDKSKTDKLKLQFIVPALNFPVTSGFGKRIHPLSYEQRIHDGIDIGTPAGTPIRAAAKGQVTFAGWDSGYGKLIVIYHGNGYETRYAHLSELYMTAGDRVTQAQVIGLSGSTGYVTGPHLHFEIRFHDTARNPMDYLNDR